MESEIRDIAYRLWEEVGRPESDGVEFWLRAEQLCKKTYDIWIEGLESMDGGYNAQFIESAEANSFQEACDKCKLNRVIGDEDKIHKGQNLYDSKTLTYFYGSMRLFDNEKDARQRCG